ncbi:MAG: tetratricopeptide repeat protein [Candidatus Melainabacteria bacterium]|jgi:tetratricopeptide (TPR) repeat protein|nr:tetratricopeptide repeat protein [Candidatus Melainabacteria bacterium]
MKSKPKSLTATLMIIALTSSSGLTPFCVLPSLAATQSQKKNPELVKIGDIEEVLYGQENSDKSEVERLKSLETTLFGKPATTGTTSARLAKIEEHLKYGTTASASSVQLAPPQAPQLDLSQIDKAEAPPLDQVTSTDYAVDARSALDEAQRLYSEGRSDEAQRAFQSILSRDPNNVDALYNLGVISEEKGNVEAALVNYRKALSLNPQDGEIKQAVLALESKKSAQARAQIDSANKSAQTQAAQQTQQAQARNQAQTANLKRQVADASADYKAGKYDAAIGKLNNVALNAPQDADVQFALAQAYRAKGDLSSARSYMSRAVSLNPSNQMFANALRDLDKAGGSNTATANNPINNDSYAANSSTSVANSQTPPGGLTPFANSHADSISSVPDDRQGYAVAGGSTSSTRLKRAVTYGIAGAATGAITGAMFGGSYNRGSRMTRNAMTGAAAGALFGLLFGR